MTTASRADIKRQDRVIFSTGMEGLFVRGLEGRLDEPTRQTLRGLGLDVGKLLPGYSIEVWEKAVALVVTRALPDLTRPEAHRFLGQRSVLGVGDTLVGKA